MTFIDTHCHICDKAFAGEEEAYISRAKEAGVEIMLQPDVDSLERKAMFDLVDRHPGVLYPMLGLYPGSVDKEWRKEIDRMLEYSDRPVVAIGEIGLDYYYDPDGAAAQRALFEKMLALALALRLPVCVHSRDADSDTLAALRDFSNHWKKSFQSLEKSVPPGILHCYTRGPEMAEELLDLGFCISFSGILSFNNAGPLRDVASRIPLDRLLVETDSPYLAPKPYRGKTCEPMYTARTGEVLAECTGIPPDTLADATTANAHRVYGGPFQP